MNEEARLTSRNWHKPSSPRALTTSLPTSLEMYSCTILMSAERNGVSLAGAMMMVVVVQLQTAAAALTTVVSGLMYGASKLSVEVSQSAQVPVAAARSSELKMARALAQMTKPRVRGRFEATCGLPQTSSSSLRPPHSQDTRLQCPVLVIDLGFDIFLDLLVADPYSIAELKPVHRLAETLSKMQSTAQQCVRGKRSISCLFERNASRETNSK